MSVTVTLAGDDYEIPTTDDLDWGSDLTDYLVALSTVTGSSNVSIGSPANGLSIAGDILSMALASAGSAGAMSASDFTKLAGITTGATNTPLAATTPADVGTAAVGVGTTAARADHVHGHGNLAGGSFHAAATSSTAGFMSTGTQTLAGAKTWSGAATFQSTIDVAGNTYPHTTGTYSLGLQAQGWLNLYFGSAGTQRGAIRDANNVALFSGGEGTTNIIRSSVSDGSVSVGTAIETSTVYTAIGSKLLSVRNGTTEKVAISKDGDGTFNGALASSNFSGTHSGTSSGTNTGDSPLTTKDEGSTLTTATTSFDFVGSGVTATNVGGAVTVTVASGGGLSLTAFGSSPNDNGLTLSSGVLNLEPASSTKPGGLSTGTQTIAGDKTFSGTLAAANLSGTNTGDSPLTTKDEGSTLTTATTSFDFVGSGVTATNVGGAVTVTVARGGGLSLTSIGSSANANGATLSSGVLNLEPASASFGGVLTTGAQTIAGAKTWSGAAAFSDTVTVTNTLSASNFSGTHSGTSSGTNTGDATITAKDEGVTLTSAATSFDFVGSGVTATNVGGAVTVTVASGGGLSLTAIGSSANANGATLSSGVLNLEPASASFGGVLTTGTQTIAGAKTWSGAAVFSTSAASPIFASSTANVASAGIVRLANTDLIDWRNNANGANLTLGTSTSDRLQFGAVNVPTISSTDTLTNKSLDSTDTLTSVVMAGTHTGAFAFDTGVTAAVYDIVSSPAINSLGPTFRLMNKTGGGGGGATIRVDLTTYDPGANSPGSRILVTDDGAYGCTWKLQTKTTGAISNSLVDRLTFSTAGNATFGGTLAASNLSGTNTGDITLGAFGSSANSSGASLSGQVLTLQPASSTQPGGVTTGAQTMAGAKTWSGAAVFSSTIAGSGNITTTTKMGVGTASIASDRTLDVHGTIGAEVANGARGVYVTNNVDSTLYISPVGSGQMRVATDLSGRWMSFADGAGSTDVFAIRGGNALFGTTTDDGVNKVQVTGSVAASKHILFNGTALPSGTDTSFYGLWVATESMITGESATTTAGFNMWSNAKRTASGWSQISTARTSWLLSLSHGTSNDYFQVSRAAAAADLNTTALVPIFKLNSSGNAGFGTGANTILKRVHSEFAGTAAAPDGFIAKCTSTGAAGYQMINSSISSTNAWQFFISNAGTPVFKIGQDNIADYLTIATSTGNTTILGTLTINNGQTVLSQTNTVSGITNKTFTSPTINSGTLSGTFSGDTTFSGNNTYSGTAAFTSTVTFSNKNTYKGVTSITAFATGGQASATALTAETNFVTTVATAADSVKLPTAALGLVIHVINTTANSCRVFPASGGAVNALGTDAGYDLAATTGVRFYASSATQWYTA